MKMNANRYSRKLNIILILVGCIVFPLCLLALVWYTTTISPEDIDKYRALTANTDSKKAEHQKDPYQAKQKRQKVQKDVLFTQGADRLQLRLLAADAQMVLDHREQDSELIEQMNNVTCYMQEEVYYLLPDGREAISQPDGRLLLKRGDPADPNAWIGKDKPGLKPMQLVRYMEADAATYYYKSELFNAKQVKISRFAVPGHELLVAWKEKKLIMKGVADSVEFSLSGKDLNFKAHKLKATLYAQGQGGAP